MRRSRTFLALVAATLVSVAACSSSSTTSSTSTSTPATNGAATSTTLAATTSVAPTSTIAAACSPAAGYTPGQTTEQHLKANGVPRDFLVHLPPATRLHAEMPIVVDFHGAGSNMQQQDVYSGFDPLADRDGFIVATPNGIDATVRQWRFLGTQDDVIFARDIVKLLSEQACGDVTRAFATGISSGGAMTASLACQASETFAGFAPVAADFYVAPICAKAAARPIVIFHGTADPVVPYSGGAVHAGSIASGTNVRPAEETAAAWAKHNGCAAGPATTTLGSQVVELAWSGCTAPVVMYKIVGGGHTWPGASFNTPLGLTTKQISASTTMLKAWGIGAATGG